MSEQEITDRAKRDEQEGKSPSQAGEFVREEMRLAAVNKAAKR